LLPVHRFNIRFSYVTKKGLPFIREFLLRLVHISPMMPAEVATYFGLSKREVDEAITDLVEKGDLHFLDSGQIDLTAQSRGYFVSLGSTPQVSSLLESGGAFAFELTSFSCVGRKRTHEKWIAGLRLEVPNEIVANSERLAKSKFQEQFHKIQEQGYWSHNINQEDPGRPSIYTMESVRKLGQEPLRLTSIFSINPEGVPVERDDFELLDDTSRVQELVTDAVSLAQKPMNFKQVAQAMEALGDLNTRKIFNDNSVDVVQLMLAQQSGRLDDSKWVPFMGPVYSKDNWQLICDHLEPILDRIKKAKSEIHDFTWIAPSDGFWGKSLRMRDCFNELVTNAMTKSENPARLYMPKLYLPIRDSSDRQVISKWKQDFGGSLLNIYGLTEGFMDGNVEVLLLPGHLAVICYHISRPESLPISLPVGFVSTDQDTVQRIQMIAEDYVDDVASFDNPRDLGLISKL